MGHYYNQGSTITEEFALRELGAKVEGLSTSNGKKYFVLTFPDGSILTFYSDDELAIPAYPIDPDESYIGDYIPFYWFYADSEMRFNVSMLNEALALYPNSYKKNGVNTSFSGTYFPSGVYQIEFNFINSINVESKQKKKVLNVTPCYEALKYTFDSTISTELDSENKYVVDTEFDMNIQNCMYIDMLVNTASYLYNSYQYLECNNHIKAFEDITTYIPYDEIQS